MDMKKTWPSIALLALMAGTACRAATPAPAHPQAAPQASIPFAAHHGIWSWRVENRRTVLIQSEAGNWYKATLMSDCFDLPFAERIGFHTNSDGSFDRFSSILVRGQSCPLISLVHAPAPAKNSPGKTVKGKGP